MFRKHADVAIAMGASPVPSPTKSPKPTRSWTSDGQPRSWTTETWAWEETINTDEPRGYLAGHRVRRERQDRQERLGSPSPSVQSFMDPRSYRRRRSEQRLEVSTKAVDVCLQELPDATEAERVRAKGGRDFLHFSQRREPRQTLSEPQLIKRTAIFIFSHDTGGR